MRNYIRSYVGHVDYTFIPNGSQQTQHFIEASREAVASEMAAFSASLDPTFFRTDATVDDGAWYWLLNQDNVLLLIDGFVSWWSLLGSDRTSRESPRKTWAHGH